MLSLGTAANVQTRHPNFWVSINKLHETINSYCVELKQIETGQKLADTKRNSRKLSTAQYEMQKKSCKMNELIPQRSLFASVGPLKDLSERWNC